MTRQLDAFAPYDPGPRAVLPAAVAPAFAAGLTFDERRELDAIFARKGHGSAVVQAYQRPPAVRRLDGNEVADLPGIASARLAKGPTTDDPARPLWLYRVGGSGPQTGNRADSPPACGNVDSVDVAPKHVSVLTRAELHQRSNSLDIRHLRHSVKNSLRSLFPRQSNLRKCGHRRHGAGVEARVRDVRQHDGTKAQLGYVAGLVRCGSVWSCPTCAASISGTRARVVSAVVEAHRAAGGGAYMLTLTARHSVKMRLPALKRAVSRGFQKFQQGKGWTLLKRQMGFVGSIRALEVTIGGNGYHPHLHILFAVRAPLSPVELRELEDAIYDRWCSSLARVSELAGVIPSRENGVRLDECHEANYIQKLGLAAELTSGIDKKARGENRTPFQVAVDWHRQHDGHDAHTFRRYARGIKGTKQLTWSRISKKSRAKGAPETDLRVIYAAAIRALDAEPEQPTLTGLESDKEILLREESAGATVAALDGRQWDALARVLRAAGEDAEYFVRQAAEREGAHGVEALLAIAHQLGKEMADAKPWLRKWLKWLAPANPLADAWRVVALRC